MGSAVTWVQVAWILGIGSAIVIILGILFAILSAYAAAFKD